jgi:2'-5' RNA ligase
VRLFVGIELDADLRARCASAGADLQERLRGARAGLDVRWVPEQNLHVTLWFLGEVPPERTSAIEQTLQSPSEVEPFVMDVSGVGIFPPSGPPRILWLGISRGADSLSACYAELSVRLAPLGFERERRPYHPHVTIGRVRDAERGAGRGARAACREIDPHPGSQKVPAMTLFQSRLSGRGAEYLPLLRVPLKGC